MSTAIEQLRDWLQYATTNDDFLSVEDVETMLALEPVTEVPTVDGMVEAMMDAWLDAEPEDAKINSDTLVKMSKALLAVAPEVTPANIPHCRTFDINGVSLCEKPARFIVWGHLIDGKGDRGPKCSEHLPEKYKGAVAVGRHVAIFDLLSVKFPVREVSTNLDFDQIYGALNDHSQKTENLCSCGAEIEHEDINLHITKKIIENLEVNR